MLRPFAHLVACCWMFLRVVAQSLKPVKRLAPCKRTQHCWPTTPNIVGSCCARLHVALNLYLLKLPTVSRPSKHLRFKSCPTFRNTLTYRKTFILFSGTYLSGRKTPVGPVAGHCKNPILPFGLGLNFLLFFRQRFLK